MRSILKNLKTIMRLFTAMSMSFDRLPNPFNVDTDLCERVMVHCLPCLDRIQSNTLGTDLVLSSRSRSNDTCTEDRQRYQGAVVFQFVHWLALHFPAPCYCAVIGGRTITRPGLPAPKLRWNVLILLAWTTAPSFNVIVPVIPFGAGSGGFGGSVGSP